MPIEATLRAYPRGGAPTRTPPRGAARAPPRPRTASGSATAIPNATSAGKLWPEIRSRPPSSSAVTGLTCATACTQPPTRASGTNTGARKSTMKTGICIAGPGLDRARAERDAGREERRRQVHERARARQPEQVDAAADDLHAGRERDAEQQDGRRSAARTSAATRVAGEDAEPVRRAEQQPPGEALLEVGRDPEAGEHAAERRRLQQHEHELERRVAGREVEARARCRRSTGRPRTP